MPQHIAEKLMRFCKSRYLNEPLAIRSSASAEDSTQASFAGIHASFLNVRGLDNILTAVKEWPPCGRRRRWRIAEK